MKNFGFERILTSGDYDHQLTCTNVFSCDSREILYDTRTQGRNPDASVIESVNCESGEIRLIYKNDTGARGAVVTCHPTERKACFIKGLDHPEINGRYHLTCRQGGIVSLDDMSDFCNIDARDVHAPFTPGALRGGSHVHVFSPDGKYISDTYDDAVCHRLRLEHDGPEGEANLRNVQINILGRPVSVPDLPGNHSGSAFTYVAARLHSDPKPGSDEIRTCEEETFIGQNGYVDACGVRHAHALAAIGEVRNADNEPVQEVYIIHLPEGEIRDSDGPIVGTPTTRPLPPAGCEQIRLTHLSERKIPGIRGTRHWLRTTPDGRWVAFFAMADDGILQAFKADTATGRVVQVSHNTFSAESQMTLSPDGLFMYYAGGGQLVRTHMEEGYTDILLVPGEHPIHSGPVVVSPDGKRVAYTRDIPGTEMLRQQICTFTLTD